MQTWLRICGSLPATTVSAVRASLHASGIELLSTPDVVQAPGVLLVAAGAGGVAEVLLAGAPAIVLRVGTAPGGEAPWTLLAAGACDVLAWPSVPPRADDVAARLARDAELRRHLDDPALRQAAVGDSAAWRRALRGVVEAACFSDAPVLLLGETGTGKEQLARLVHDRSARAAAPFVVQDCTTLTAELAGSELFGHERGAYTGAAAAREGAFALAHRGTLFLDEVGELPLPLQAQLLRVVQERQYKRLGGNSWQSSDFRLVCATHRDLAALVDQGRFRADLYHRLAGWTLEVPPLRARRSDVPRLAEHFLRECGAAEEVLLDDSVRSFLLARDYPGNVRELRQLVRRLWFRHAGPAPLTAGDVPEAERPAGAGAGWPDAGFEASIRLAVEHGVSLNEIGQRAKDLAVRAALEREGHSVQRAAARLQVSDRLLQIRRKEAAADPRAR